jgi:hypothetical protein
MDAGSTPDSANHRRYITRFGFALVWAALLLVTAAHIGPIDCCTAGESLAPAVRTVNARCRRPGRGRRTGFVHERFISGVVTLDPVPPPPRSSTITWRRVVGIGVVWCLATVLVLLVAAETRIGPVLVTLTRGHGVHVGDAVALVLSYAAAGLLTWRLLRHGRSARDVSITEGRSSVIDAQPTPPVKRCR